MIFITTFFSFVLKFNSYKKTLYMKSYYSVFFILCSFLSFAQVGIGTTNPNATLDIISSSVTNPSNDEGILIPKMNNFPSVNPTINQDGMMIFITGSGAIQKGFYFWNNNLTSWLPVNDNKAIIRIYPTANISSFSNFSEFNLVFNNSTFNLGGGIHNTTIGSYGVPFAGIYEINANLNFNFNASPTNQIICVFRVYVNGAMRSQYSRQDGANINAGYSQNFHYNSNLNLNRGDVVTFRILPVWGVTLPAPTITTASEIIISKVY